MGADAGMAWSLRAAAVALSMCSTSARARAQEAAEPLAPPAEVPGPRHTFELAVDDDSIWAGYRNGLQRGERNVFELEFLASEGDDYAAAARMLRYGEPLDVPVGLGVGLGFYAGFLDSPNAELYALTLSGAADYTFATEVPVRLASQVSWAPDATTFDEGEGLIDLDLRLELDVARSAALFARYRLLEAEVTGDHEPSLDRGFQVGVRIGV